MRRPIRQRLTEHERAKLRREIEELGDQRTAIQIGINRGSVTRGASGAPLNTHTAEAIRAYLGPVNQAA